MKSWFMFFLGTIAFFLYKYINRKEKAEFKPVFWAKNNGLQLIYSFIIDFAFAFAFMSEAPNIDFTKIEWIPTWIPVGLVIMLVMFALGYGGGLVVYGRMKKKIPSGK